MSENKADELSAEQKAMLKKCFDTFDREKTGSISADMVGTILNMMGLQCNSRELREIIEEIDVDGSGMIEFDEFIVLAAKFMVEEDTAVMEHELREAFRLYDREGNGYITTETLREILRELDEKLTEDQLDEMIDEIDADGSGTIDYDEFMEMMRGE